MIAEDEGRTEADAVADVSAKPVIEDRDDERHVLTPPGWYHGSQNIEKSKPAPNRLRGTTKVDNSEALIKAVEVQSPRGDYFPVVYSQDRLLTIIAVLNHQQVTDAPEPGVTVGGDDQKVITGWGDHRVQLTLNRTPDWLLWLEHSGKWLDQTPFAEFIEDRIDDIRPAQDGNPDQATMLELSRTFQATIAARFERGVKLGSGQVNLNYQEQIDATAGETKQLQIPDQFGIAVRPFFGSDLCSIQARFRHRVAGGQLKLSYQLVRPDLIERTIFDEEVEKVSEALSVTVIAGAADPVTPTS